MLWSPGDPRSTIVLAFDEESKRFAFVRVGLMSSQSSLLMSIGLSSTLIAQQLVGTVSRDGRQFVYFSQDAQHDWDLWLTDADFDNPRRLTHINPQFDGRRMGAARLVEWRSLDGEVLRGALLLPSDYQNGKRYPLVFGYTAGYMGQITSRTLAFLMGARLISNSLRPGDTPSCSLTLHNIWEHRWWTWRRPCFQALRS